MHSNPCQRSNSSFCPCSLNFASLLGISFSGHASTHRPQLMHASGSNSATSSFPRHNREEVVFVVGTSSPKMANPIIGPPDTSFSGCTLNPPAASTSCSYGVPILYKKFDGVVIASPVIVAIRFITGTPSFTACLIAIMVSTLSTIQPASAGSILELISRPVTA